MNESVFGKYTSLVLVLCIAYLTYFAYRLFIRLSQRAESHAEHGDVIELVLTTDEALQMWQTIFKNAHSSLASIEFVQQENVSLLPSSAVLAQCIEIELAAFLVKKTFLHLDEFDKCAVTMQEVASSDDKTTQRALEIVFANDKSYLEILSSNVERIRNYSLNTGALKPQKGPYTHMMTGIIAILCGDAVDCVNEYYALGQELDESVLIALLPGKRFH